MKYYGLLGYPLGHTMSPPIHKRLFELEGVADYEYKLLEIPENELNDRVGEVISLEGSNVTIPHKGNIIQYLDELDDSAKRYMSVNCIAKRDGKTIGYNTDCDGFLRSIEAAGGTLDGKVLQCGCGGVGRMIAIEAVRHGAELTVSVMKGFEETVEPVREYARKNSIDTIIRTVHPDEIDLTEKFDTLINATPVGMYPKTDACPVSEDVIKNAGFVFDVIYNPEETLLMKTARNHGIKAAGGMAMLVYQAVVAHEYWSGAAYNTEDIQKLIADMHALMREQK